MNKLQLFFKLLLLCICIVFFHASAFGQVTNSAKIDLKKTRAIIDSLNKQGSRYFLKGDSVGMYKMYSKDADLGGIKGKEILSYWGAQIRNSIKDDTRTMIFTTTSLSTDGEFLVELGTYAIKGSNGNAKGEGKYLIVWKQEDGTWKLYRDIPL